MRTDQLMAHRGSETASSIALLRGWRLLAGADRHRTRELRIEAQRCFRLAQSTVGIALAAELEAIGLQFDKEAGELSARMQAVAYQNCYTGFGRQQAGTYCLPKFHDVYGYAHGIR
jgi:hypothetical protein